MKDKILLFLLVPYLSIGAVVCNQVDGKMVCSGTGQLEADIGGQYLIITNLVVTNVVGVCTNCVDMSPQFCTQTKSIILDTYHNIIFPTLQNIRSNISTKYIDDLLNDIFPYIDSLPSDVFDSITFNTSRMYDQMQSIESDINSIESASITAAQMVDFDINCSECVSYSPSVITNNKYIIITNESSSTSGNWATYDQMEALKDYTINIKSSVDNILKESKILNNTLSNFWKDVHSDLKGISNIVHRLDDYARGDFSNSIYHINLNVGEIVKAISNMNYNLFINQQYSNATYYVDLNNQPAPLSDLRSRLLRENDTFDFGEFGNLSWFQRVEFLLLEISGLNNLTNTVEDNAQFQAEARENYKSSKNLLESVSSQGTQLESSISALGDSVKRFAGSFSFPVDGSGQLVLVENFWSKMPGYNSASRSTADLVMPVDSRLREFLRVLSSLFWTAFSLVILYRMTIFWIHFFWDAWDRFMKTAIESVT